MKLSDISNGPDWVIWVGFIIFTIISVMLLSGRGSWFISGYNMASSQEKARYNEKKLCRTTGFAMAALGIITTDCLVIIILSHTICKKQD